MNHEYGNLKTEIELRIRCSKGLSSGIAGLRPISTSLTGQTAALTFGHNHNNGCVLLNTTSNYALRAVGYLASLDPKRKADSVEISEATGVPRRFLLKILNTLRIQRILDASRGIGGGYWLAKSPDSITMFEVIQLFGNTQRLGNCPFGGEVCDNKEKCPFHDGWANVREAFIEFLKTSSFVGFTGIEFNDRFPYFPGPQ